MSRLYKVIIELGINGIIPPDGIIFPDIKDKKNNTLVINLEK
jgi:hypothetical protein